MKERGQFLFDFSYLRIGYLQLLAIMSIHRAFHTGEWESGIDINKLHTN